MDDTTLRTIWQQRQFEDRSVPLAQPLTFLMKHVLAKRLRQLGNLAKIWDDVLPRSVRLNWSDLPDFPQGSTRNRMRSSLEPCRS